MLDTHGVDLEPTGLADVVAIGAGSRHALAVTAQGTVIGWGDAEGGQSTVPTGLSSVTASRRVRPTASPSWRAAGRRTRVPPVVTVPGFITKAATSSAGARVWATGSAYDAVADDVPAVCTYARGSWFPLGRTVVSCTARDPSANSTSASFTVKIIERR